MIKKYKTQDSRLNPSKPFWITFYQYNDPKTPGNEEPGKPVDHKIFKNIYL